MQELEKKIETNNTNESSNSSFKGCIWWVVVLIGVVTIKVIVKDFFSVR